jgi:adenylate cyclase
MKKTVFAFIVFLFIAVPASANKYLDSLYLKYKSARADTAKYKVLYYIIYEQYVNPANENYHPDAVRNLLDKTLEDLWNKKDLCRFNSLLKLKAEASLNTRKYELAIRYYDSCIRIAERYGNNNEIGALYSSKRVVYLLMNLNERMVQSVYKSIDYYKKGGSVPGQAASFFSLGNIYQINQQYDLSLRAFLQAADMFRKLNDSINAGICYVFSAGIAIKKGDFKLAEEYLKKGRPVIYSRYVYQSLYYFSTYGQWLKAMNRNKEALDNLEIAANIAEKHQHYQKASILSEMAEICINEKKFEKAKLMLEEAKSIAESEGFLYTKISVRSVFSKYYETHNEPLRALEEYKALQALKDSSNQEELGRALTSSDKEAEYNKKEAEYADEQRKKDEHAAQKLKQQKLIAYSAGVVLLFVGFLAFFIYRNYRQQKKANTIIAAEKKHSEDLLLNILPAEVAEELKQTGRCQAKTFSMVTVMFADFKDFTSVSEKVSAELLVDEINYCFSAFDRILPKYKVEKIKTVGDAYICVSGMPVLNFTHAFDLVSAALEIRNFMLTRKQEKEARGEIPFQLRIGIHTGPVVAGIVGVKKFQYDIWGDTVNLAARMEQSGEAGQVNISGTTYALVKDKFTCKHRGKIVAKNKGEFDMYFVEK